MDEKSRLLKELEEQVNYYKIIAEKSGQKRLREIEHLNNLISERAKSEIALRESELRFRIIAQSTNDIFYEWDIESGTLRWLGDIDGALGYKQGAIGHTLKDWLDLILPEDRPSLDDAVILHKKSVKPIQYTYRVMCKDGTIRYWYDNGSPILNTDGTPRKWVGGISDITEQKKAEEALVQAQRLSAIGEVASGVAHDFNNALQGIIGNIELALLEPFSAELRDYLETIRQSAHDAASRIQQLQRFTGEGKEQNNYVSENLNQIADAVVLQTRPLWKDESEKAGIAIEIDKRLTKHEIVVHANAGELRSALYNLFKNSIQAMPSGGRLTIETGKSGSNAFVIISDTGAGMDDETKAKIFQPFFTTKGFEFGKGLGLSIANAIIKEHRGELNIKESAPGRGTSIEITLPLLKAAEPGTDNSAVPDFEGSAKVLWVEDEALIRLQGQKILEKLNHRVSTAATGEEALDHLQNCKFDILVTDVGMPNMSGWQLVEKIKGKYPDMKVAVVTGWGADVFKEEKVKYAIDYFLGKPIHMEQLKRIVGEVLCQKQAKEQGKLENFEIAAGTARPESEK